MTKEKIENLEENIVCLVCGKPIPEDRSGQCCSDSCEVLYLRERVQKLEKPKGIQCIGVIKLKTCIQELYLTETYDAKRRACQLRKLGYEVIAKCNGDLPVAVSDGQVTLKPVTVLFAWSSRDGNVVPNDVEVIDKIV